MKLDLLVNVDLPQPLAPAMMVSRAKSLSIRRILLCGLLLVAFLDDFPKTPAIDRQLRTRVLGHLLSDLKPVH